MKTSSRTERLLQPVAFQQPAQEEEPRYLKQALSLGEGVALHGPEVDVGFSTGDDQVRVHGVKHGCQHGVVGALQAEK